MDSIQYYCAGTLAWLTIQAIPLTLFPGVILSILHDPHQADTPLEVYFARSTGFALATLGLIHILVSGVIPLTTSLSEVSVTPIANAVMLTSTTYHTFTAFYCYVQYTHTGLGAFILGALGSSFLTVIGFGCCLFAGNTSTVSKNLKLYKATSSFPFKNNEAYHRKKANIRSGGGEVYEMEDLKQK